jgi:hypothetical protein
MQSSLLQIHWRFGTDLGVPLGAGRGIAISRSLSGEEHCGHVGCESVITTSPRVSKWILPTKSPDLRGFSMKLRD